MLGHIQTGMSRLADLLARCEGFDWDEGNIGKNWEKHRVTDWECEEVFFNRALGTRFGFQALAVRIALLRAWSNRTEDL